MIGAIICSGYDNMLQLYVISNHHLMSVAYFPSCKKKQVMKFFEA